jgi:hypothetical protein
MGILFRLEASKFCGSHARVAAELVHLVARRFYQQK